MQPHAVPPMYPFWPMVEIVVGFLLCVWMMWKLAVALTDMVETFDRIEALVGDLQEPVPSPYIDSNCWGFTHGDKTK